MKAQARVELAEARAAGLAEAMAALLKNMPEANRPLHSVSEGAWALRKVLAPHYERLQQLHTLHRFAVYDGQAGRDFLLPEEVPLPKRPVPTPPTDEQQAVPCLCRWHLNTPVYLPPTKDRPERWHTPEGCGEFQGVGRTPPRPRYMPLVFGRGETRESYLARCFPESPLR